MDLFENAGRDSDQMLVLSNFKIVGNLTDSDSRYRNIPDAILQIVGPLQKDIHKGSHKATEKLIKLIEKYPRVPLLYNFLSTKRPKNTDYSWYL